MAHTSIASTSGEYFASVYIYSEGQQDIYLFICFSIIVVIFEYHIDFFWLSIVFIFSGITCLVQTLLG